MARHDQIGIAASMHSHMEGASVPFSKLAWRPPRGRDVETPQPTSEISLTGACRPRLTLCRHRHFTLHTGMTNNDKGEAHG